MDFKIRSKIKWNPILEEKMRISFLNLTGHDNRGFFRSLVSYLNWKQRFREFN